MKIKNVLIMSSRVSLEQKIDMSRIFKKTDKFLRHDKIPVKIWIDGDYKIIGFLEKIRLNKKGVFGDMHVSADISMEVWSNGKNKGLIRGIRFINKFNVFKFY